MMSWTKAALVAGGVAAIAFSAWPAVFWFVVYRLEKPRYQFLRKLGRQPRAELRHYKPYLIAEVEVEDNNMREAMSQGFRQVAGFIFGKNSPAGADQAGSDTSVKGQPVAMTSPVAMELPEGSGPSTSIAMTSPVAAEMHGDGKYRVSFMMPSKYTTDSLPVPHNPNVKIREVPERLVAAMGFSGKSPSKEKVDEYTQQLQAVLQEEKLEQVGPASLLQYHPPFAPGWIRINEVVIPVKPK